MARRKSGTMSNKQVDERAKKSRNVRVSPKKQMITRESTEAAKTSSTKKSMTQADKRKAMQTSRSTSGKLANTAMKSAASRAGEKVVKGTHEFVRNQAKKLTGPKSVGPSMIKKIVGRTGLVGAAGAAGYGLGNLLGLDEVGKKLGSDLGGMEQKIRVAKGEATRSTPAIPKAMPSVKKPEATPMKRTVTGPKANEFVGSDAPRYKEGIDFASETANTADRKHGESAKYRAAYDLKYGKKQGTSMHSTGKKAADATYKTEYDAAYNSGKQSTPKGKGLLDRYKEAMRARPMTFGSKNRQS